MIPELKSGVVAKVNQSVFLFHLPESHLLFAPIFFCLAISGTIGSIWEACVANGNAKERGENFQRKTKGVILKFGMGLMAQLVAELEP